MKITKIAVGFTTLIIPIAAYIDWILLARTSLFNYLLICTGESLIFIISFLAGLYYDKSIKDYNGGRYYYMGRSRG